MQQKISSFSTAGTSPAITMQMVRAAMAIVTRPDTNHPPSLRRWAWAALKSARGQTISQTGLNRLTSPHPHTQGRAA